MSRSRARARGARRRPCRKTPCSADCPGSDCCNSRLEARMDGYHIALFVHFCALLGAIAAAAVVHLGTARRDAARTVGSQLEWHSLVLSVSKFFPIALLVLVLSGSYMINKGGLAW